LLCILGATTLLSWAIFPIQVGVILGLAFSFFIGALPTLAALSYLGLVGYMVVTFCLINAGSAALAEMVQSARRRPKEQPKWSANR
ncbi:MAG: hypothetical protein K2N29_02230, partial [Ruminiclostridium sp.]|nr:hypothetical protein [Ruminiclostridium sp.]